MENFEERKIQYFKRLNDNPFILLNLYRNNEEAKINIILDPKTERELLIAESIITFTSDTIDIMENLDSINVSREELDNSITINLFVNIIYALKENDKDEINRIKEYLSKNIDPDYAARLMFDFLVVFSSNIEEGINEIARRTGYSPYDEEFNNYLSKANEITSSNNNTNFDFENEEIIDATIQMINKFHELYQSKQNEMVLKKRKK